MLRGHLNAPPGPCHPSLRNWTTLFALTVACAAALVAPVSAQELQHIWSHRFGSTNSDVGLAVAVDSTGDVLVTGFFEGTVDFGGGPLISAGSGDIIVAKYTPDGTHLWSKRFGGSEGDVGTGIGVDTSGNVVVTGRFRQTVDFGGGPLISAGERDIFVAKFTPEGTHLWSKSFGSSGTDGGSDLALDGVGNVVVTGFFEGTVDFGGEPLTSVGGLDIFVAKFTPEGTHLWSRSGGEAGNDGGSGIGVDTTGDVLLTGEVCDDTTCTVDFSQGFATATGNFDFVVAKFSGTDGATAWSFRYGGAGDVRGLALKVDTQGDVLAAGALRGTVDFGGGPLVSAGENDIFVAKFAGADGAHVWAKRFGGTSPDEGLGLAVDSTGNAVVTGDFTGQVDLGGGALISTGESDIFLAKFASADGAHLWSKRFGSSTSDFGLGVAVDGSSDVVVTGFFEGTVDFGGGPLTSAGGRDIFLLRLGPTTVAAATSPATSVTSSSGTVNGTVNPGGSPGNINFEWGTDPTLASPNFAFDCFLTTACPAVNPDSTTQAFSATLNGLASNTTYYYRIVFYDSGNGSIQRGSIVSFTTMQTTATTLPATSITSSSAALNGTVNPGGSPGNINFEWGTDPALTSPNFAFDCFITTACPAVNADSTTQSFSATLSGLASNTTYYYRMVFYNSGNGEVQRGNILNFTTLPEVVVAPVVTLSRTSIQFRNQIVNTTSAAETLTLTNTGAGTLVISSIGITQPTFFTQNNDCVPNVTPGASCTIRVTFSPTTQGVYGDVLTIIDNAPGNPHTVSLSGTAISEALSFGDVVVGIVSAPKRMTLTNATSGTLTLGISLNNSHFALQSEDCTPSGVPPGQSCAISVTFAPTAFGAVNGTLNIITNAPESPHKVSLVGTGIRAEDLTDTDGDGIPDTWEINGIYFDNDGNVDLPLHQAPYNADPAVKDVFIEIDYMEGFRPSPFALANVKELFDRQGIRLHFIGTDLVTFKKADEAIPFSPEINFPAVMDDRCPTAVSFDEGVLNSVRG